MVSIRPATADDVPALVQLRMANGERHAALAPARYRLPDVAAVQRYFTDRLANPSPDAGSVMLVAELAGTVAGMTEVVVMPVPPDHQILVPCRLAEVHTVVLERYRGKGIGKALVATAEQHATAYGVTLLLAPILTANTPAVAFYTRAGFVAHGVILAKGLGAT